MAFGIGFFWGLMESLWFFVVPDVALSFLSLRGWRAALGATVGAIVGAMCGCVVLHFILVASPLLMDDLLLLWSRLPGYYPKMIEVVRANLEESGARGLLAGPSSGIPYRYYILEAIRLELPLVGLLAWTPAARLVRIAIAPMLVLALNWALRQSVRRLWPRWEVHLGRFLVLIISVYWIGLYIWYWGIFLPQTYIR